MEETIVFDLGEIDGRHVELSSNDYIMGVGHRPHKGDGDEHSISIHVDGALFYRIDTLNPFVDDYNTNRAIGDVTYGFYRCVYGCAEDIFNLFKANTRKLLIELSRISPVKRAARNS